jgi:hypothetical protein
VPAGTFLQQTDGITTKAPVGEDCSMSRLHLRCPYCWAGLSTTDPDALSRPITCPRCRQSFCAPVLPQQPPPLPTARPQPGAVPWWSPAPASARARRTLGPGRRLLIAGVAAVVAVGALAAFWLPRRPDPSEPEAVPTAEPVRVVARAAEKPRRPGPAGAPAGARGGPERPGDRDRAAGPGARFALLVGVLEYRHARLADLKYTENDVEDLAGLLTRPGAGFAEVRLLTTKRGKERGADAPTAANIRAALRRLLAGKGKRDTVLVALSGHGLQRRDPRTGKAESFFCPSDTRPDDPTTLLSLDGLFADLKRSGAGVKLLLVDACRNELPRARSFDAEALPRPPRGTAALFSCSSGQRAFETDVLGHGIFFHFILEGLRGKAANEDNEVGWDDLAAYVKRQVSRQTPKFAGGGARQTPHEIKDLVGEPPVLLRLPAVAKRPAPPKTKEAPRAEAKKEASRPAPGVPAAPARRRSLVGTWRGERMQGGLKFVMVNTFRPDGTVLQTVTWGAVRWSGRGTYTYKDDIVAYSWQSGSGGRNSVEWLNDNQFRQTNVWSTNAENVGMVATFTRVR